MWAEALLWCYYNYVVALSYAGILLNVKNTTYSERRETVEW